MSTDGEMSDEERRVIDTINAMDEGYDPIEGCTRYDVGWMKYEARALIPRAYTLLMDFRWADAYARPPEIQNV